MKKVFALFVACLLALNLSGCVGGGESAQKAVENTLKALKNADVKTVSKYLSYDDLLESDLIDTDSEAVVKILFEHLSYKIIKAEEKEDSAVVTAEITNVDMAKVFPELFSQMLVSAFSGKEITEEETITIFGELIQKFKDQTVTVQVDIHLTKKDGQWKIEAGDSFQDAILGGMYSVVQDMNNAFSGLGD